MSRRIRNPGKCERHTSLPAGFSQQELQDRTEGKTGVGHNDPFRKISSTRMPEEKIGVQPAGPEQSFSLSPESPFGEFEFPEKRLPPQKRPADKTLVPVRGRGVPERACPIDARDAQNRQTPVRLDRPKHI